MNRHIRGTSEYRKYLHNRLGKGLPPQGDFAPEVRDDVEREVLDALKSGQYELRKMPDGSHRAKIKLARNEGTCYNIEGKTSRTSFVLVSVSLKNGVHFYPDREE